MIPLGDGGHSPDTTAALVSYLHAPFLPTLQWADSWTLKRAHNEAGWCGGVVKSSRRMPGLPKAGEAFVLIYVFELINGKENKVLTGLNLQCFLPRHFKGTPHADAQRGLVRIGHAQTNVASSAPRNSPGARGQDCSKVYFKRSL